VLNVFLTALLLNVLLLCLWPAIHSTPGFYAWTVIYGLVAAAFQSLFPTAIASLSTDITKTGTRLGMAFSVIGFAALVAGPIGGALLGADGGRYLGPQVWAVVSTVVGTALIAATRVRKNGWKLRTKC
jgi:MFS family permease